jgi:site-specific recombinase XerC
MTISPKLDHGRKLLAVPSGESVQDKRDYAILSLLLGCGLRRAELTGLTLGHLQQRDEHWAIVNLYGKGGHVRAVPVPFWVKTALDQWLVAASISEGAIFRRVSRTGNVWGTKISEKLVWWIVRQRVQVAESRDWPPTTSAAPVLGCATRREESWSRTSSATAPSQLR